MNYQEFKEAVIAAAGQSHVAEYELYYQEDSELSVSIYKQEVKEYNTAEQAGVCLRCVVNGKIGCASTELFSPVEAKLLVERAVENAGSIEKEEKAFFHEAGDIYQVVSDQTAPDYSPELVTRTAMNCQKKAYELDCRVIDGTESMGLTSRSRICLTNSRGLDLCQDIGMDAAYTLAIVQEPGDPEMYMGMEIQITDLEKINPEEIARKAIDDAVSQMNPSCVTSGVYPVVISGKAMGSMLHTFGSVFSAEAAQHGLSLLKGKEGVSIASDCITLIDNPFYEGSTVQMPFDAEGVATYTKEVVKDGVLNTLLYNLGTADKAGEGHKSTGNASKSSYGAPVSIEPYYFYVKPGTDTREDIFAKAGNGIYVTELNGMHAGADPRTGDFSLSAAGFLLEEGKKGKAIKGFTISGNFFRMLETITAVGSDLEFGIPRGVSAYGAPSVLVAELSVAGK